MKKWVSVGMTLTPQIGSIDTVRYRPWTGDTPSGGLVANGTFDDSTGWALGAGSTISGGVLTIGSGTTNIGDLTATIPAGSTVRVTGTRAGTGNQPRIKLAGPGGETALQNTTTGDFTLTFSVTGDANKIHVLAAPLGGGGATIDNLVAEIV